MAIIKQIADATKKVANTVKKVATENKASSNDNAGSWISNSANGTKTNTGTTSSTGDKWVYTPTNNSSSGVSSSGTYEDEINNLKKAQQRIATQQLKQQRDSALKELERQERDIPETYQTQRNAVSASSQQGARSFAEYLANRGLSNSGAAAQGEINRISTLQNNLNSINNAETKAIRDIADKQYDVNADYAKSLAEANLQLELEALEKYSTAKKEAEQQKLQNEIISISQYSDDFMAEIQRRQAINPNDPLIPHLWQARNEKINNITQAENEQLQLQIDNAWKIFNTLGVANEYVSSVLGIPVGTKTLDYQNTMSQINNRYRNSGSGGGGNGNNGLYDYDFHDDVINNKKKESSTKIEDAAEYIYKQLQNNTMSQQDAEKLMVAHDVPDSKVDAGTYYETLVNTEDYYKNFLGGQSFAEKMKPYIQQEVRNGNISPIDGNDIIKLLSER